MKLRARKPTTQRGAALIVMMTVLILGIAWYTVGALGKAPRSPAEREARTAAALAAGKRALLDYVAYRAGRTDENAPGRLPCPEPLTPAASDEGVAAGCSANNTTYVGRLPWRTLGVDQIRDGDGEALWYILGSGFRQAPINFGTLGAIELDGANNAAVALIIAPGTPLNTSALAGAPAACPAVNQTPRIVTPGTFDPARFVECGRNIVPAPGGEPQYVTTNAEPWTNDRIIVVTAADVMDAIAAPVAQRLQRQVAPAMSDFRSTTSLAAWGERFLPHASTFNAITNSPPNNNLCGNHDVRAGMPPTATVASGTCNTNWSSGTSFGLGGLLSLLGGACSIDASYLTCRYGLLVTGLATPWITATAPRIGNSFRTFNPASVETRTISGFGTSAWTPATVRNYSANVSSASSQATVQFEVDVNILWWLVGGTTEVRVPHPSDALSGDARVDWYLNNNWDRFTYYAVTRAATVDPGATVCNPGGTITDCLSVAGLPASGLPPPTNDKRLVLALMGPRPVGAAAWPSADPASYLEGANATPADGTFEVRPVTTAFNDRLAACPLRYTRPDGSTLATVCN